MARFYPSGGASGGVGSDELTAVAATDLVAGTTAVTSDSDDEAINGGLADKNDTTQEAKATLDTTNSRLQMTIPALGRYNTNSKLYAAFSAIASLIGLTAAKLIGGNTVLGVAGTGLNDATISGTAQLRKGVIAYGKNGVQYTGTMTEKAAQTYTPGTAAQTIAANQYLAGVQTIAAIPSKTGSVTIGSSKRDFIDGDGNTVSLYYGAVTFTKYPVHFSFSRDGSNSYAYMETWAEYIRYSINESGNYKWVTLASCISGTTFYIPFYMATTGQYRIVG